MLNTTRAIQETTTALEATHAAIAKNVDDLQQTQRAVRRMIDEERLRHRPNYPTTAQLQGIYEAVRRYRAGETAASHHGDHVGPESEPAAVRYAPQGELGWMHIAHGAPLRFTGDGHHLWTFTEDEIAFFLDYITSEGIEVTEHWPSDGGLSLRFREAELRIEGWRADPHYDNGGSPA